MDTVRLARDIAQFWEDAILPSLSEFIRIPNRSPLFDVNWEENGHMETAVQHAYTWCRQHAPPGLDLAIRRLAGRTPVLYGELAGDKPGTILLYGHLDKQPEFTGWQDGLGPWEPVRRDEKLYGRGGADDGYAIYAALAAVRALQSQGLPHPRLVFLIECSEESGSPDLPAHMQALDEQIGLVDLVIALDSTCGDYERLWTTTSLRGNLVGTLKAQVLKEGVHSGAAGGIVPSSFLVLRRILDRLEESATGKLRPAFLHVPISAKRVQEAQATAAVIGLDGFRHSYSLAQDLTTLSEDGAELVLNNTWRGTLAVTGAEGLPPLRAPNTLRPYTTLELSLRLPPTVNAQAAGEALKVLLEEAPPFGASVSFTVAGTASGWSAPELKPGLEASLNRASEAHFGRPAVATGCGGTIPFMQYLADQFPQAQFLVTGVLGPMSNAHGPNEFLHIPTGKKLTACVAQVVAEFAPGA